MQFPQRSLQIAVETHQRVVPCYCFQVAPKVVTNFAVSELGILLKNVLSKIKNKPGTKGQKAP